VLTLHRPSNVDQPEILDRLLKATTEIARDLPVLFPIHPRTLGAFASLALHTISSQAPQRAFGPWILCDTSISSASLITLDWYSPIPAVSRKKTTVLGVPCLTLRENTERLVTVEQGTNQVIGTDPQRIIEAALRALCNVSWGALTCLDFLIHVELRISAFRQTRWACDSPDCCAVALRYIPLASMRSFP
jgi:UDP-N-acetylglucosamine 2-epimerase (non-hydrolysing)